jgi:aminopeptidase YwaD
MSDRIDAPQVTDANVKRAFSLTNEVVDGFPGRLTGTESCRKAGVRVKQEFEKHCDPGSVKSEEFILHPWSFLKYIPGLVVLYFACMILLYFGLPWIAFAGLAVGMFAFIGQFLFYWHLLDPLFPAAKASNIIGVIEPEGEVKQQIIVSGHHDAAYVFQILEHLPKLYFPLMMAGVGLLLLGLLLSLVAAVLSIFAVLLPQWVALVFIVLGIFVIPFLFFTTSQVVPGAGDNMIAVAIAAEIGSLFGGAKKSGKTALKHTRLILASFDAEEAGLRGAQAYVKQHKDELLKTKTYVLNIDTLYRLSSLNFFAYDLNATVKLSKQMAEECAGIAQALGYKAALSGMAPGGGSTDAAAFGEAGIEATNLSAMSHVGMEREKVWVYHTAEDTSKHIEPEVVEAALKIIREYILRKDAAIAL